MSTYKVLVTDYAWPDLDIERGRLAEIDAELVVAEDASPGNLADLAADVDAIMFNWAKVPASVIEAATRCRIASRLGIGLDNIDIAACTKRGIVVTNIPDYCLIEVAEHAMALLLGLARKVAFYHFETKSGRYDLQAGAVLRRVSGQTLGIVGMGHIGRQVATRARAFGLEILAYDVQPSEVDGVRFCDLAELLESSDYVTLHVPLLAATRHLISSEELSRMKPSAYLINTARGGLVDHQALAAALADNQIAGAALDVQEPEPPDLSQPPFNDPRVIVTPHAAFNSAESLEELRNRVAAQVVDHLSGRVPESVANPEVLGK